MSAGAFPIWLADQRLSVGRLSGDRLSVGPSSVGGRQAFDKFAQRILSDEAAVAEAYRFESAAGDQFVHGAATYAQTSLYALDVVESR